VNEQLSVRPQMQVSSEPVFPPEQVFSESQACISNPAMSARIATPGTRASNVILRPRTREP